MPLKKLTTEEFVERAKAVHGDDYDYTDTQYINMQHKVVVRCPLHGVFVQLPQAHLRGQGCPVCGKEKYKKSMLDKYGADNPMKVKALYDKARATSKERYGSEWAWNDPDVKAKSQATVRAKYGVDYIGQSLEVHAKAQATTKVRYGVENVSVLPEIQAKRKATNLERYGVEEVLSSPEFRDKIQATNQERYGGNAPMASVEIQAKFKQTSLERYGVVHPGQTESVKNKIRGTKSSHGTFCISFGEDRLYEMLCNEFGADDVRRPYISDVYPFACDYYISSRDLYIELNASWTHGPHWYSGSDSDLAMVSLWRERGTKYYENAVHVWTCADVKKREMARLHGLNYVVFWDSRLRDAELWFALGCPDGQDWDRTYSWIPDRVVENQSICEYTTGSSSKLSAIAKSHQFSAFYSREIALWNENPMFRNLDFHVWMYHNRLVYLNKLPFELSNLEILRGMNIAGVLKGYTVFDTSMMAAVIDKYGIKSVYDPCAGWGERFLYCATHGVVYHGVDINESLRSGYETMLEKYGNANTNVIFLDSAKYVPVVTVDAVLTCPPYGSLEIYSSDGAENLDEDSFSDWWNRVVDNSLKSEPEFFCVQTNQKYRDVFSQVLVNRGWSLVDEFSLPSKSGHFTRRNGVNTKCEFESMLVFCHN